MPQVTHLETVEIEPDQSADATIIWMHGLGADAYDFYSVPSQLGLPTRLNVRYVFPNAPRIPVTINMGLIMRAWYDVRGFDKRSEDQQQIRSSARWIMELVARENERGVQANRVVLAGFSQGGAMALFTGLRYPEPLAGIMCLSGYLLLHENLAKEATNNNRDVSIFQAHGSNDPIVPYALGRSSYDVLTKANYQIDWHEYPMAHQVCDKELQDVGTWLTNVFS